MNILKWMWKILPIMLLAVNATACNDDDDSGKRERPLTFEVTFLELGLQLYPTGCCKCSFYW